jgi:hypothetical protein
MPPRMRRATRSGRSSSRRKLVWATSSTSVALGASPTFNNIDLLANLRVAGSSVLGATIMRTHLTLLVDNTGRAVTSRSTYGVIVEDQENVGGVVDLASNPGRDWAYLVSRSPVSAGGAIGQELIEVDLRAKRKVQELDQSWLLCMDNNAGPAMTYRVWARTLVALP